VGWDSSVSIVTRYWLDGPGIEFRWGGGLSSPVQTGPGVHPASYTMGTGSFLGVKWLGPGVDHPHPSSPEVKERVELYFYSPSGPSWPVQGRTLLTVTNNCIWHTCITWQGTNYRLPEDDTLMSKHVGGVLIICETVVHLLVIVQNNKKCVVQILK